MVFNIFYMSLLMHGMWNISYLNKFIFAYIAWVSKHSSLLATCLVLTRYRQFSERNTSEVQICHQEIILKFDL